MSAPEVRVSQFLAEAFLGSERLRVSHLVVEVFAAVSLIDAEVSCSDVTLRFDAPELISAARWRITTADDPDFLAPIVDTGLVDPVYETLPDGTPTNTVIFGAMLQPGTYLADLQLTLEAGGGGGLPPTRFTILGMAVEFWGGFHSGVR